MTLALDALTPPQRAAVTHREGPLLVLAGAGSGKTRVITHRVAHLIDGGVAPRAILAITFTNKAAGEMRERIAQLTSGARVWVSTFHAFCARTLRRYAAWVDLNRDFTILDAGDQQVAIREALLETGTDPKLYGPAKVLYAIERAKDLLQGPEALEDEACSQFEKAVARAYAYYQSLLRENDALDFSDLLVKTVELLRQDEVREVLAERFRFLLIDEYQDTNHAQYQLARLLSQAHRNVCATGDPDQSIYGWRGADIANILRFEKDYPEARVVKLEENFRSTQLILDAANGLIRHNHERREKELRSAGPEGEPLEFAILGDEYEEARYVARRVRERLADGISANELAVFYRAGSLSRPLEAAFQEQRIAYRVVGSVAFFQRREIKDLLAYLRLALNPRDDLAAQRVANVPTRGIGKTTLRKLKERARQAGSILEAGEALLKARALRGRGRSGVEEFLRIARALQDEQARHPTVEETLRSVLAQTQYRQHLEASAATPFEAEDRLMNVESLLEGARDFDRRHPPPPPPPTRIAPEDAGSLPLFAELTAEAPAEDPPAEDPPDPGELDAEPEQGGLAGFLEQAALMTSAEENQDPDAERVSLMTIHAAKGLEFDSVFVVGMEDGAFPHSRAMEAAGGLEEERRLAYVAITRAKRRLVLTRANYRRVAGNTIPQHPSLFLHEIPAEVFVASAAPAELERSFATCAEGGDFDGVDVPAWDDPWSALARGRGGRRSWEQPLSARGRSRSRPSRAKPRAKPDKAALAAAAELARVARDAGERRLEFTVGDRVEHEHFGPGVVLAVHGRDHGRRAQVEFDHHGVKDLVLQFARMTKLA